MRFISSARSQQFLVLSGAFVLLPALSAACSPAGDADPPAHGGATASNGGQTTTLQGGQNSAGGTTSSGGASAGGSGSGGATSGGAGNGSGGSGNGGISSSNGGSSQGGGNSTSGGSSQGGASSGGKSTAGGSSSGGSSSGGSPGTTSGGKSAGGTGSGGNTAKGGATSGGATTGGAASGGAASGGSGSGGATTTVGKGPAETKAVGYGRNATGAGSASPVSVSTFAAAQAAVDAYSGSGGLAITYTGKVNYASITDPCTQWKLPAQILEIKQKSNITILGADGSAANFGIHIASSSSNIIVRNMTFGLLPGADASDAISIEGMSSGTPSNIWIDHNEFFSSMVECSGAGDTSFDGLIDLKKGAENVTVSYNYIHDHHKVSLNGFSDSDTDVRHITFYRNVFQNVGSRTPLQRGGFSHVLNNLFTGIVTSGVNVRMNGYSLIESNFFENAKNPVTSRDSDALGYWELKGNNVTSPADFTKYAITWTASDSSPTKDATDWTTTKTYPEALGYTFTAVAPQCLKDGLKAVAGSGKGLATLTCK